MKDLWNKAKWPVKAAVIAAAVAVAIKVVLWLEASGVITNVVK
jgi:hypothetical protein